jgi:medium-chain acyl-[acyl-carrier-protein] hydrolase
MKNSKWLVRSGVNKNVDFRLFCFSYAGGNAATFRRWHNKFTDNVEVVSIQLPGRANRFGEPVITEMEPLVDQVLNAVSGCLDKPYALFGHSLGSRIAFQLAVECSKNGLRMPCHFIASASRSPDLPIGIGDIYKLPDEEFLTEMGKLNGTPLSILKNKELMQMLLPQLKADFCLAYEYQYADDIKLDIPVSVFGGEEDTDIAYSQLQSWDKYFVTPPDITMFEGGHFFIEDENSGIVDKVNLIINDAMRGLCTKSSANTRKKVVVAV